MNIRELIQIVDNQSLSEAKPKVKQDAQGNWVDAETGAPVQTTDNTVPFPSQAQQAEPAPAAPAASQTGDATLDKPLPAKEPTDPNAPGKATKFGRGVGQFAKGIGAVAGGIAGMGRAIKKGYQVGADTVGGPGAPKAASGAPSAPKAASSQGGGQQAAGSADVQKELDDLRQMINRVDAKLVKAGIQQQ